MSDQGTNLGSYPLVYNLAIGGESMTQQPESYVEANKHGVTFVGPDATRLYQAIALKHAINFYLSSNGLRMTRMLGPTLMAKSVSSLTHKNYTSGKRGLAIAVKDLDQWIEAMKAAIPLITDSDSVD